MGRKSESTAGSLQTMSIPPGLEVMEDGKPFFFEGGKVGCLLIHGFTGTTSSLKPMGEHLASKGLTVLGPRLPGHGTNVKDMGRYGWRDWVDTVETALDEISSMCDTVFASGLSMGGTLTLYLGENHGDRLAGIAPISAPALTIASGANKVLLKLVPVLKHVLKTFPGPGNDLKDPDCTEVAYDKLNTAALSEFLVLLDDVRENLGRITIPIRIFHAHEDHVVPPENAPYILDRVSSTDKDLIWLDNCYHVATLDLQKGKVFSDTYDFISKIAGPEV
ncbi:MAG: alpha/beta fold hydrolase [Actinobacteria bacterium]|nr:alpha/beta fold hydrolase [Actinomycetota bacterium]MBU1942188.1 alpha/beta fold hydrolase [Actinomycetota bacterium]MBU2688047.1 alpha/beta fold hydrolase [Actinomycetota bacterium]